MWITSGSYVGHIWIAQWVEWVNKCDPLSTLLCWHISCGPKYVYIMMFLNYSLQYLLDMQANGYACIWIFILLPQVRYFRRHGVKLSIHNNIHYRVVFHVS